MCHTCILNKVLFSTLIFLLCFMFLFLYYNFLCKTIFLLGGTRYKFEEIGHVINFHCWFIFITLYLIILIKETFIFYENIKIDYIIINLTTNLLFTFVRKYFNKILKFIYNFYKFLMYYGHSNYQDCLNSIFYSDDKVLMCWIFFYLICDVMPCKLSCALSFVHINKVTSF